MRPWKAEREFSELYGGVEGASGRRWRGGVCVKVEGADYGEVAVGCECGADAQEVLMQFVL